MAGAAAIEDVFSLCFGGVEGNGALMLGDVPPATFNVELQYTPLVFSAVHPHYYLAHLQNIAVDGAILPVDQVRLECVCVASKSTAPYCLWTRYGCLSVCALHQNYG